MFAIAVALLLAAAATPAAAAVCYANGRACGAPITANDRLCCPGSICGPWGNVCQPGCRINNTAYRAGQLNPANSCQVCTPTVSTTQWSSVSNGTSCSDYNRCTRNDSCQGGSCVGSNPVTCYAQDECHSAGTCNPSTGYCSNPSKPEGASCNDYNGCTTGDVCHAGTCCGTPVVCSAQDQCHDAGRCDRTTGQCSNPSKPDGTTCNDNDLCTLGDACTGGNCGGAPVDCSADECHDPCHLSGTCDPSTGLCVRPDAPDGKPCSDGDICSIDFCIQGVCTPVYPNPIYDHCSDGVQNCDEEGIDCGAACLNSCSPDPECEGQTCATFTPCNTGGSCGPFGVCVSLYEGGGSCLDGTTSCGSLTACPNGVGDCASGDVCAVDTCCGFNVCVPPSAHCSETFAPVQRLPQGAGPSLGSR